MLLAGCSESKPPAPAPEVLSFGLTPDRPALRSSKAAWEPSGITSATVYMGDRIEIRPQKLVRRERQIGAPVTSRTEAKVCDFHAQVCTAVVPIFEQQCRNQCKVCEKCELFGCHFETCCKSVCENVHTRDQCTAWEDRCFLERTTWQDETRYPGLGDPASKDDPEPMKSTEQMLHGIHLKLDAVDFVTPTSVTDCALSAFSPTVTGDAIVFTLGNVPSCPGLFADPSRGKTLTLINRMSVTGSYQEGRLLKNQGGSEPEKPASKTYEIPVDFIGSFTIVPGPSRPEIPSTDWSDYE